MAEATRGGRNAKVSRASCPLWNGFIVLIAQCKSSVVIGSFSIFSVVRHLET